MAVSLFFTSCVEAGGIYHYALQNGSIALRDFTPCDRPMYAIAEENRLWVLLRECFNDHTSGLQEYAIPDSGMLMPVGAPISTKGIVPCHALKRFDVAVGDLDVGYALILPDELLYRLLAGGLFRCGTGFLQPLLLAACQIFQNGGFQQPRRELGCADDQRDRSVFHFFLHGSSLLSRIVG